MPTLDLSRLPLPETFSEERPLEAAFVYRAATTAGTFSRTVRASDQTPPAAQDPESNWFLFLLYVFLALGFVMVSGLVYAIFAG